MLMNSFWNIFAALVLHRGQNKQRKVHHYQLSNMGKEFVFEPLTRDKGYSYITARGEDVKNGDCIRIDDPLGCTDYQIVEIDHYRDSPDIWMAKVCCRARLLL